MVTGPFGIINTERKHYKKARLSEKTKRMLHFFVSTGYEHSGYLDSYGNIVVSGRGKQYQTTVLPESEIMKGLDFIIKLRAKAACLFHTHPDSAIPSMPDLLNANNPPVPVSNIIAGQEGIIQIYIDEDKFFEFVSNEIIYFCGIKLVGDRYQTSEDAKKFEAALHDIYEGDNPDKTMKFATFVQEKYVTPGKIIASWLWAMEMMGAHIEYLEEW